MQVVPAYSAIKVNGVKSYEAARRGRIINISPREIEIKQAKLIGITGDAIDEDCIWNIELNVSKGTYIRSIARGLGVSLGVPAHLSALKRIRSGAITSDVCASIEAIERDGASCALDPVKTLGLRSVFVPEDLYKALENGAPISATDLEIYSCKQGYDDACACSGSFSECKDGFRANEKICMLLPGELKAIYVFDAETNRLLPECVFQIGVKRGSIN